MALLQISEPGMSTAPHQHRLAIGIDLGTTHSLVASVSSGSAKVLSDEANKQVIPSIVHYMKDGTVLVGDAAQQTLNPSSSHDAVEQSDAVENTIYSVKRLLGRSYADLEGTSFSYTVKAGADETPLIETRHGEKNAVQVSADILNYLRELAEANLADTISGAVITVPAYFDEAQRQATKQAAQIAGIKVLRLLNEPTAAAIAYGLEQKQALQQGDEQHIIVYDLGGGTFDVSILLLKQGVYQVMATGGDTQLGGDDFDRLLAEYSANAFGIDISTLSPIDYSALMRSARAAKEQLSHANDSEIRFKTHAVRIDRDLCDTLFSPLIKKTLRACKRAMRDAELDLNSIDEIIMVGGSTRLLSVQSAVHQFFSKSLNNDIDPDKVVAIGAAVQADILIGNKSSEEVLLLDVVPLSLGIETYGGLVEKIISRNSTIPVARAQEFTTFKDNQTAMSVHVLQGERETVNDTRSLAKFSLKGIPPMVAGAARIKVGFQVDADGLLTVTAAETSTGVEAQVEVKPSFGLSDSDVEQMIVESMSHAEGDKFKRAFLEQMVDAERTLEALSAALADDGDIMLNKDELSSILGQRDALVALLNESQSASPEDAQQQSKILKQAVANLERAAEIYVSRRMDSNVQTALKGRSVEDI